MIIQEHRTIDGMPHYSIIDDRSLDITLNRINFAEGHAEETEVVGKIADRLFITEDGLRHLLKDNPDLLEQCLDHAKDHGTYIRTKQGNGITPVKVAIGRGLGKSRWELEHDIEWALRRKQLLHIKLRGMSSLGQSGIDRRLVSAISEAITASNEELAKNLAEALAEIIEKNNLKIYQDLVDRGVIKT